jgi:tRNA dimethylallyltransferase
MNLGTGKVTGHWQAVPVASHPEQSEGSKASHPQRGEQSKRKFKKVYFYKSIPHHLIDVQNPKKQYSVVQFQKSAQKLIEEITQRQKLPILCGGTGQYIDAVIFNQSLPQVKPNLKLRKTLEKKSIRELYTQLLNLDPLRAQHIDKNNPRRLIRALEIVITTGQPVPVLSNNHKLLSKNSHVLWLGLQLPKDPLYKKIKARLQQRLKAGMVKEVKKLKQQGLSWQRLESFGLEYRYISRYLRGKINYEEMFNGLLLAIQHYTKRQMTWWKKNPAIHWLKPPTPNTDKLILKFLKS